MGKQRLNSAGWTVLILGLLLIFSIIAAVTSGFAWLQGRDQIGRLERIARDTRGLLTERIRQNDESEAQRKAETDKLEARQREANRLIAEAIARIQLNTALSVDCAFLRDQGIKPRQCKEVNDRFDSLERNVPINVIPATTTTTQPRSSPTTSTTTTTQPPRPQNPTINTCRGIRLLGLCIGG